MTFPPQNPAPRAPAPHPAPPPQMATPDAFAALAHSLAASDYGIGLELQHWTLMDRPLPLPPFFTPQFNAFMLLLQASQASQASQPVPQ